MPSRRAFLKTIAAAPAAAAIGAGGIVEAVSAPVAAAIPAPYSYPWQWWFSYDGGEVYTDCFDTQEAAADHALSSGGGLIAECQQRDFDLSLDGYDLLEMLDNRNEEAIGEGDGIQATDEEQKDLGYMVTAAIEEWARKHKIGLTALTFGGVRNKTEIPDVITPKIVC